MTLREAARSIPEGSRANCRSQRGRADITATCVCAREKRREKKKKKREKDERKTNRCAFVVLVLSSWLLPTPPLEPPLPPRGPPTTRARSFPSLHPRELPRHVVVPLASLVFHPLRCVSAAKRSRSSISAGVFPLRRAPAPSGESATQPGINLNYSNIIHPSSLEAFQ